MQNKKVCIIGAGPAGLSAAYVLAKYGIQTIILEADSEYVGGISKTVCHEGFRFDIGGHRFYSKSSEVVDFWNEILGNDMIERKRLSRIYFRQKFFSYPLDPANALSRLGIIEAIRCVLSYFYRCVFPVKNVISYQDWVINNFGDRLFKLFFKNYTEKVWGMPCTEISADWASQRIKGLSLWKAITSFLKWKDTKDIKTLAEVFQYPKLGPGMLWEKCNEIVNQKGGVTKMGASVKSISYNETSRLWSVCYIQNGKEVELSDCTDVISTAPLNWLINNISPAPDAKILATGSSLSYRDYLMVAVFLKDCNTFDDQWVYIHDNNISACRIQNFRSWSEEMVPGKEYNCLGFEYFLNEDSMEWKKEDSYWEKLAVAELYKLKLAKPENVRGAFVIRQKKAYPVYNLDYSSKISVLAQYVKSIPGLHVAGRNGMHKYNNQDHSIMTGMISARNIIEGNDKLDAWKVNQEAQYIEDGIASYNFEAGRIAPKSISTSK